ncbi:hypothetical protein [Microbacter margulisiae]|uniref:Protein argonaute n=1 Tax=Microbacter margulisiae TaxID=1350067 RepID=A0A7W5DSE8_9PORP|nr:hypothetical protein [Microbacter margulisiae]MBB3187378.1 hypothetical protein [Microbacter margulisiae]
MNYLTLNVLNFKHAQPRLTVYLTKEEQPDSISFSEYDCKELNTMIKNDGRLYATLTRQQKDQVAVTRCFNQDLCSEREIPWSFSFMKRYYTYRLVHHFREMGIPATHNFVSDTDVWIKDYSAYPGCEGYRVFTLRVQVSHSDGQPQLLVAMGDVHSVHTCPVTDPLFSEVPESVIRKVLYQQAIYHYDQLPVQAKRHLESVYPCMNFELLHYLKINRPAPDKSNRYLKYSSETEKFRQHYLTGGLHAIMQPEETWCKTETGKLDLTSMLQLRFGEGVHAEPKYGFKQYGPVELIDRETVFFFIMHIDDIPLAYTINDYLRGQQPDFRGGLPRYLKIKYNTESRLSIVFRDRNNPIGEIEAMLKRRALDTDAKNYVAIYLSPHSKWTTDLTHKNIYYRVKELLLSYNIVSQTIEVEKHWSPDRPVSNEGDAKKAIMTGNFQYSLPNILVAISAKLGYTPWCFEQQPAKELVVGISAYRSRDLDRNYLGSAFTFTNEGRFVGFDCLKDKQVKELAGLIALTLREYCLNAGKPERLVIHFYKRLSRRELQPIEKALSELGLSVPVVVVSVNKGFANDIVGFDHSRQHKMPLSGLYIPISPYQYLLFNNQQQTGEEAINEREGYPFPLKLTLQKYEPGMNTAIPVGKTEAEELMVQVCRFSQLYWKSVSRQWMPVTLRYPEMLAQIVPHFKYLDMPEMGKENLWFL